MTEILKAIHELPMVESVQSLISKGKVKHYRVYVEVEGLELQESLEGLWSFGTITLNGGNISADYIIQPNEIADFYKKIASLSRGHLHLAQKSC